MVMYMADKQVARAAFTTMIAQVLGRGLLAVVEYFLDLQVTFRLLVGHELLSVMVAVAVKPVVMVAAKETVSGVAVEAAGVLLVVTTLAYPAVQAERLYREVTQKVPGVVQYTEVRK